ncbi:MAG TPA: hypothetical protein VI894_00515 [Candidatus Nanoarchaeia archaeon]|nr:hypothetical protein [Candidatus Nanoarchaeia archaeon]
MTMELRSRREPPLATLVADTYGLNFDLRMLCTCWLNGSVLNLAFARVSISSLSASFITELTSP